MPDFRRRLIVLATAVAAMATLALPAPASAAPVVRATTRDVTVPWGTVLVPGTTWAGSQIAGMGDVNVYSNGDGNQDRYGTYGLSYECVELAARWAAVRYGEQIWWNVQAAYQMWDRGPQLKIPFNQLPNGGALAPQFGDILVFGATSTAPYGHVAVVSGTRPGFVDIVEQNWSVNSPTGKASLPISGTTMPSRYGLPILGWLRSSTEMTGYWMLGGDGGVFPYGTARGYGSTGGMTLNQPIVGMAAAPGGTGYWLVASDGGIFPFGPGAGGYGSTGALRLNRPIVGMAPTPSGHGYWLVATDGGIFPFGDAGGYGSTGGITLNQPIVGMTPTATGHGYWLVASDGGIFPFGDATGYGSTGGMTLNNPIVGMAATAAGHGYWLVASDGGIFPFGDAVGYGSTGGRTLAAPVVGITATPSRHGYWLTGADGAVYPFGDAEAIGNLAGTHLNASIIAMATVLPAPGRKLP